MANEEEYWEATFPSGKTVAGVYPSLKIERQALQTVSKSAKKDPLIAMKESQENLIRLCVKEVDGQSVNYADMRGAKLEEQFDPKELYMLTELFESWQTPEASEVESFLGSAKMRATSSTKTSSTSKGAPSRES